jgi:hypothetical protein
VILRLAPALLIAACLSPGPGRAIAVLPCCAAQLAADSSSVYVALFDYSHPGAADVYRVGLTPDAGAPSLFTRFSALGQIAAAAGRVYLLDNGADGGIFVAAAAGEEPRLLVDEQQVVRVAADADRLYWLRADPPNSPQPYRIRTAPADGGPAADVGLGDALALGGDALYWTNGSSLMRAPKTDLSRATEVGRSTAPFGYAQFGALGAGDTAIAWGDRNGNVLVSQAGGRPTRVGSVPAYPSFLAMLPDRIFAQTFDFAYTPEKDAFFQPPIRHRMYKLQGGRADEIAEGQTATPADGFAVAGPGGVYWILDNVLYRVDL